MRSLVYLVNLVIVGFVSLASCSSEDEPLAGGEGLVRLALTSVTGYGVESKTVDESTYKDLADYQVEILNGNTVLNAFKYSEMPEFIAMSAGNYTLKAYKGEDVAASITSMYVEGLAPFTVTAKDTVSASVTCSPTCAKVIMDYAETMDTYFSDYSVSFKTSFTETPFSLSKTNKNLPVYLKAKNQETLNVKIVMEKKSDKTSATIDKAYTVNPGQALTIHIVPKISSGNLGLSITIDEQTNDHPIDIIIPSDWVTSQK